MNNAALTVTFSGATPEAQGATATPVDPATLPAPEPPWRMVGHFRECEAPGEAVDLALDTPLKERGAILLRFKTKRGYLNGNNQPWALDTPLEVPGVARFFLGLPEDIVSAIFGWKWLAPSIPETFGHSLMVVVPELPEDEYTFLATWDAAKGLFNMYMNGISVRKLDTPLDPWEAPAIETLRLRPGFFDYLALEAAPAFLPAEEAWNETPEGLRGRYKEQLGKMEGIAPIDVESRRGELLYENTLADADCVKDWVLDAGRISFEDGWMRMESPCPDASDPSQGHQVYWCPEEFPASFVAEWETRVLADDIFIVFFAAKGENGESIFDPAMPERDGNFIYYIKDRMVSYHVSFYSGNRGITNLRKNNKFFLLATGGPGIPAFSRKPHRVRLVKDGSHIQVHVDGEPTLDCADDKPERYDPPHGAGCIGFRQMRKGVGRYRNFRVYALKDDPAS